MPIYNPHMNFHGSLLEGQCHTIEGFYVRLLFNNPIYELSPREDVVEGKMIIVG
jgi:hypothetical protein